MDREPVQAMKERGDKIKFGATEDEQAIVLRVLLAVLSKSFHPWWLVVSPFIPVCWLAVSSSTPLSVL